jgi:beta-lactamase superfamily II metal-dependent hydrolase
VIIGIMSSTAERPVEVDVLNVGQGDAIFVRTENGKTILIDGGSSRVVLEGLSRHMSVFARDIDVVIATHADSDHVTGLIPVFAKYHVHHIIVSPVRGDTKTFEVFYNAVQQEEQEGAQLHTGRRGDRIIFSSSTEMQIVYPPETISSHTDTNDASVSTLLTHAGHSFLLTGDLPLEREGNLVSLLPRHITMYKAGHHGSKTSSGAMLLSYIEPEYAVISAGKNNKYGHPHTETLERLKHYSREILSTIDRGDISFFSYTDRFEVRTQK